MNKYVNKLRIFGIIQYPVGSYMHSQLFGNFMWISWESNAQIQISQEGGVTHANLLLGKSRLSNHYRHVPFHKNLRYFWFKGSTGTEKYASERSMDATKDMGYIHSMQLSILYILK